MNRANFLNHMAPTNRSGQDLQPMDQAAKEIQFRRQTERRAENKAALYGEGVAGPSAVSVGDGADWQRDYEIQRSVGKRGRLGGMTMRPTDALTNMPRHTFRDE